MFADWFLANFVETSSILEVSSLLAKRVWQLANKRKSPGRKTKA